MRAPVEVHHEVPRYLLRLRDRADALGFTGEAIELALEFENECVRYGVDVGIAREDLAALIDASTVLLPREEHRSLHESCFSRWGRRGGRETHRRYGRRYYALLAGVRWGRPGAAAELAAHMDRRRA